MNRNLVSPIALTLAAASAACGSGLPAPRYFAEVPPESKSWTEIPSLPVWVTAAPASDGTLRLVVEGRSNDRFIAAARGGPVRQIERRIEKTLAPVVGPEDAARAAAAGAAATTLVERVAQDEVLTRELVPGNTLSTVWTLCEVPLDAVLAPIPADERDAARAALGR